MNPFVSQDKPGPSMRPMQKVTPMMVWCGPSASGVLHLPALWVQKERGEQEGEQSRRLEGLLHTSAPFPPYSNSRGRSEIWDCKMLHKGRQVWSCPVFALIGESHILEPSDVSSHLHYNHDDCLILYTMDARSPLQRKPLPCKRLAIGQ